MLLKTIGITAAFLALSADAYGFLRYPPPRRVSDRIRPLMRKALKHLDDREIIRMPVDQFPEKLEGLDFLCRGIPYDEQNVQRYFPGGQIDMMWETGGVSDAVCKIKIVCPAKNYEKELWSGDCATAAGIERRQIFIPPDFECRMGECNLVWLMETKTQNSFCDCIDIYVPPCANNQCTIITNEESCSTCQPITTVVTIETVSQASTSTMTQTLETTVDSVVTTTIEDTMTVTSLITSLATDVSVSTLISVIEVTETVSGGIVTSLLTTTQTTELTWVTTMIDTLFETSVIATTQTQEMTMLTTMLQVFTVTVTKPSQVVVASSVTVTETMVESSTSVAIVTMTEVTTALTEQTLNTTITMVETITNDQTSSFTVTMTATSEIVVTHEVSETMVTETFTDVFPTETETAAVESTSEVAITGIPLPTLSSKVLSSTVVVSEEVGPATECLPCVEHTLTVTMTATETVERTVEACSMTPTCAPETITVTESLCPSDEATTMTDKLQTPEVIYTSTEMSPEPTIIFNPDSCEEGMQQCSGKRYYKVCAGGKWSEPRIVAPDTLLCCQQNGRNVRIVRVEEVN